FVNVTTVCPLTTGAAAEKPTVPPPIRDSVNAAVGVVAKFTGKSKVTARLVTRDRWGDPSLTSVLSTCGGAGVRSSTDIEYEGNVNEKSVLLPLGVNVIEGAVCVRLACPSVVFC